MIVCQIAPEEHSLSLLSSLFPYLDSSIRAYHEGGRRTSASGQTR